VGKPSLKTRHFHPVVIIILLLFLGLALYGVFSYLTLPYWKRVQLQQDIQQWRRGLGVILTNNISESKLSIQRTLTNEKYTLTVVTEPPEIVESIQVYSGSTGGRRGDPRYDEIIFPNAQLVMEKAPDPSGKTNFLLDPGKYFIYPIINYDHELAIKGGMVSFGAFPREVILDYDMEIEPDFFVTH